MNLRQYGDSRTIGGIGLVLLGMLFFAATFGLFGLTWGNSWPAYLLRPTRIEFLSVAATRSHIRLQYTRPGGESWSRDMLAA